MSLLLSSVLPTIPLALPTDPVITVARRAGRPAGSKNRPKQKGVANNVVKMPNAPGRPPGSPIDSRLSDPKFAKDVRALSKKWRCRNMKQFLTLARQATETRMKFDMTEERRKEMFALFADGKKPRFVAEKMGCSVAHANNVKIQWARSARRSA